jgi:hypothetical protein
MVRYRNQPGDERADFQQYDPEGQAITTRWAWHEPTLPMPDPRPLGGLVIHDSRGYQLKLPLQSPAVSLSSPIGPQGNGNGKHSP